MNEIITSIPHAGSRFLSDRLGIKDIVHTECNWTQLIEKTAGHAIVSPLRRPIAVLRSAVSKTPMQVPFDIAGWIHNWYMMHTLSRMRTVDFICLEDQDDERISDWSRLPNNDIVVHRAMPAIDLSKIYELPFVQRYYG